MALATAGRAAHPIFAGGLRAVIGCCKLHAPDVLLVDPIRGEILDEPVIERPVGIECEASAQRGGVPGVGRCADVPKVGGGGHASHGARVATAAKVAVLA